MAPFSVFCQGHYSCLELGKYDSRWGKLLAFLYQILLRAGFLPIKPCSRSALIPIIPHSTPKGT